MTFKSIILWGFYYKVCKTTTIMPGTNNGLLFLLLQLPLLLIIFMIVFLVALDITSRCIVKCYLPTDSLKFTILWWSPLQLPLDLKAELDSSGRQPGEPSFGESSGSPRTEFEI